jgi:hypothetical protein
MTRISMKTCGNCQDQIAGKTARKWNQHISTFVLGAKLSKLIQHEVSQSQYDRLLRDTAHHPRFDAMSQEQRKAWLDARVSVA